MGAKDVYEQLKREKQQGNSKAKKVYAQMMQSKIIDEFNSLIKHNSDFYNKTKSRFYDEDDNFIDIYRSDSEDWKNTAVSMSSSAREKSTNIRSLLDEYGSYYDADTVSSMLKTLDEHEKFSTDIVKQAVEQHDYFSEYKDENDYNQKVVIPKNQNEEWASANTEALKTEIGNLETSYKAYSELKSKRNLRSSQLISNYIKSGYTRDEAVKLAAKDKDIIEYDKKLSVYGDMSNAEKSLSEKKQFYNNATRVQEGLSLSGITDPSSKHYDPNYLKYSAKGEAMGDEKNGGFFTPDTQRKNQVAYLRNNPDMLELYEETANDANGASWGTSERILLDQIEYKAAKYMTDEEFLIYNAYLGKGDKESADKYLESIEETLTSRQGAAISEQQDTWLKKQLFSVYAGLDQWEQGIISLGNTEGKYDSPTGVQFASGTIREDLGAIGQGAYDLGVTTGNMLPSILVSYLTSGVGGAVGLGAKAAGTLGKVAGAATLGSSAAGNGYQEMLNLGYDKSQAQAYGTLVGLSEAGLEYVLGGISSLGGTVSGGITDKVVTKLVSNMDKAIAKVAIGAGGKLVGSMVSEFGEEYLQEVLDPVFKNITLNTDEDIRLFSSEALYAGILGALSAGLLEGGSSISGEVATYKAGKDVKNTGQLSNLKKFGTSFSADTVAYKIASQVDENTDAYTIGQLLHEVGADSLSEANIADIVKSLERKNISPEHAQTIAEWLNASVQGEVFNPLQRLALKNPDIAQTFKDVIINQNSTVNQRMQSYTDILQNIANEKEIIKANKSKAKAEKKANKTKTTEETKTTPFVPLSNEAITASKIESLAKELESEGVSPELAQVMAQRKVSESSEGKSVADTENAIENKFETNLDGQTLNTKTGDSVNVSEIASIKDGKMTLKLDNGETVDADDISFGTEDEGLIYSTVLDMGVNAAVANSLVKNYSPSDKLSARQYALGIKEAYKYGSYGMPINEISKNGFAADLSEAQRTHAYNLGKSDRTAKVEKAQKEVQKVVSGKNGIEGKVHFKGDELALKEVQRESLKRMGILSEVLGLNFHVFESYVDKNGKRVYKDTDGKIKKAPNGFYKNGEIYIDLNAGKDGQGIMIYTVAHELTHWIREWSPAKFKVLADFLFEQYGKGNRNVNKLIEDQITNAKNNGRTIDYDTAYEEVVADSMETMLSDDNVLEKIMLLKSKDESIIKKIGEFFEKIINSFKNLMQKYPPETTEGKLVSQMNDAFEELQSLFAEALVDASNNYQANKGQKNTTSEGDVKLQARELQRKDPTTLKEDELTTLLEYTKDKVLSDDTYIPVRINTPQILIAFAKEFGYTLENHPLAMQVYKARQALSNEENWDGDYQDKPHDLSPEEVIGIIRAMNNPSHLVFQTENERFAEIVKFEKEGSKEKAYAIVDFSDVNKNPDLMNGYKGGKYNILVTVYPSEDAADLKRYLSNKNHKVLTGEQMKKKGLSQGSYGGNTPSLLNDSPFFEDSIPQTSKKSQEKLSGRENFIGERNLEDFAEAKDTEGKTLFQYRAMESDEDVYREMLKTANIMSDSEINALFDTVDRAMDIIKDNLEILDYAWETDIDDRAFNPVKKNTDKLYQVSVDFSTLCRKRLLQQAIQAHLQEALNRPLTKNEGIAIRDALMTIQEEGKQIEIACALCYVESARMKSPAQIKRFIDGRETVIKNYFAGKSAEVKAQLKEAEAKARERLGVYDTPLTKLPSKAQKDIRGAKKDVISSYVPSAKEQELIEIAKGMSVNDFVTPKGLETLIKKYPDLFDAYASFIVNATHSKGIENDTWWRAGDSKNIGDTLIANMNAENGLRSQSWSDFQVIHLLDYMAATIELSTRKAKMQTYTKVPDFVELMGSTGEMINLSLIPTRNFNGTLDFDGIEGMEFEESLRLRDKYHATAGTIAIGVDNVQIQMLLDSMNIDYVIPYHRSGMAKAVRKAMHIPTWTEYENYQSEKNLSRDAAREQAKKYGVKLLSESDSNYQKHPNFSDWFDITEARQIAKMENSTPSDKAMAKKYGVMYGGYKAMQNAANNYLRLCAERSISPKFSHENANFTTEANYWKLLIDRKMIDNVTGEVIEQQAVKPIFDQGEVLRILNDELERYPSVKADQDYATRKVTENFLSGNIKGGMSAEAIAKAMKKSVDNIAKVNILASMGDSKLSDRDSEGNTLSKEQQEFFKDSKVRDEKGNLKIMYHGTSKGGHTVFDTYGSNYGLFGTGSYFTDNRDIAESYTKKGKGNNQQVYDTYLNITNPIDMDAQADVSKWEKQFPDADFSNCTTNEECYRAMEEWLEDEMLPKWEAAEIAIDGLQEMGYDGVTHIGGGRVNTDSTRHRVYIAFDSNQIKETTNTNPTSDPDIRYSERDAIESENKILDLESQISEIEEQLSEDIFDEIPDDERKKMNNQLWKLRNELQKLEKAEREATVKTSLSEIRDNLDKYRYIDLRSLAEGLGWEEYADLSKTQLANALRESLNEIEQEWKEDETSDFNSAKDGMWIRPISEEESNKVIKVKFQDRDADTTENIEKINKQLAKENLKLIEDVKYLKELVKLQGKETHGKVLKKSTVELVAKRLMTYVSARGNTSELVGHLTNVYNYIIQGEDVSWEGIQEKAEAAADWLMQNEHHKPVRDDVANEILHYLRTTGISFDSGQKQEAAYRYDSFNNFRKKNMGRLKITNDGLPLDMAWQELASMYPGYFDPEVNSNDQPLVLMDIIDGLQNTYELDDYHYYSDEMIKQDLLMKIYEGYWDVSALHTVADAKQKEINLLKAKHRESMDSLRQTHAEADAKLRQEHKDKISQLRSQYREREEKKVQKVAEYYQKSRKEAVDRVKESREKRDAITKLQRLVLDTAKWVSYPAKDAVKCPDIIKVPYAEFLESIDLSSKRLLSGGEPTQNDLRVASAMDSLAKAIEQKLGTQRPDTDTETVLDTGYLDLPVHFVENLKELAESLKKRMATDGHIVNSMTSTEIRDLTKFIRTLNHSIKEMSTLYANMRFAKVEQLGTDTMVFLKYLGEHKQSNSIVDFVTWDNALPYYTFKRFGEGGESVFEELMDAQDKLAYLADGIFKFKENTWTDKEASEWSKDTHTIKLPSGRELTLTSADAMSIYCLSRRDQGKQHLLGGGVRVLGIEKNGKKANDSRSLLNQQDLVAIANSLTERQKKVAEAIQRYMSTTCAEWGNEISMKRFLTKEFNEQFYFPIESNDENLDTKDPKAQQSDLYRLLNISATKPLTKGANNEVIIRNVFDVFANHSSDMAKLNAFGMALLDYMKWINYRVKTVNDDGQISVSGVRKSMEKAYGSEANKYVLSLIKDINGRYNDNGDNKFLMKMIRGAKTVMVGNNLRVALLQFTAYPRAAMVLSNKSLALGLTKVPQIEKAKKYCGIALWKSFGFYDTNISKSIEEQIKGATNIRQKLIELSLKGAEWGDAITWGCLWNACEYEVAKTNKYKVGSEEFNQAVGKKLREVVYATQVVDSTLTRSQMMRSKSGLNQTASAFMSEPTLSANMLMDVAFQFNLEKRRTGSAKAAWKKTSKYVGKAVGVYCVVQLFAALAESLMDAYRDDDDEEFKKKFGEAFKENAISDLNPINKIPIVADISEMLLSLTGIGYYSSDSLYSTAIDEFKNVFETWQKVINGEDGKTVYAGIYSTTKLLSYITGVSGSGLMREVVTLWNNTAGAADPYLKIRTYETSSTDKGIAEYQFDKGDTASVKTTISKMIKDKVKSGKTEKEAKSAVRSSFTSTYKPEYMVAVKSKDYDEMNRIRKLLYATDLYGTLSELDETLKKWRTTE
jgi:hypothetical protein